MAVNPAQLVNKQQQQQKKQLIEVPEMFHRRMLKNSLGDQDV